MSQTMLTAMAGQAETHGGATAIAMLRALSVVAPLQVRPVAAAAADRLVSAGAADPGWASVLGSPKPGACFGYADMFGAQETMAVTFGYGRKRHAAAVLIDHDRGGGIKDCWPSDQPGQMRTEYRRAASWNDLELREYNPAEAAAILGRALSKEPCPEQPDQVEDVNAYLELLRHRTELLAGDATAPAPRSATGTRPAKNARPKVHRLKITLRGAKPPIWRRLDVPSQTTLDRLHQTIQEAFGWGNAHLWVFETPLGSYGRSDPELGHRSATAKRLADVALAAGDRLRYTYDFGDDWEHDILVEDVAPAEAGVAYPRCLTGRRACPPEDCGGIWGYEDLLAILDDPAHPDHQERLDWLGLGSADELDPVAFDRDAINKALTTRILVRG